MVEWEIHINQYKLELYNVKIDKKTTGENHCLAGLKTVK